MPTITVTAFRRPKLLSLMLQSLVANDFDGWRILIAIEPSPIAKELAGVAAQVLNGYAVDIAVNEVRLGIAENPRRLLERAFADSELVLYLEEDLLVAPDTTKLALWYQANHRPDWLCLNLIAGGCSSAGLLSNPDYPEMLFVGRTFNSLGFAARREEWRCYIRETWTEASRPIVQFDGALTGGWDWAIAAAVMNSSHLRTVQPVLARSTHTGREDGEFCSARFHDVAFADLPISSCSPGSVSYRIVPIDQLPTVVRRHALLWLAMTDAWRALAHRGSAAAKLAAYLQRDGRSP